MILDTQGLPVLNQFSEEGFVDCVFKIESPECDDRFYTFKLFASHNEKRVGLAVRLVKDVQPGFDQDMNLIRDHVYHKGVSFCSLGQVSDDLITAISELYGMDAGPHIMIEEESFTMIALHKEDTDLERHAVRMKLFGRDSEPFAEDAYYESFFTVDLSGGFAYWNEKDFDYRSPLIKALGS